MIDHKIPINLSFRGYFHKDIQIFYIWRMFFELNRLGMMVYRVWFYILVTLPILVFLPFLLLSTLSQHSYPQFFWMARNLWARPILYGMGCMPRIQWEERLQKGKSHMLVANHGSMLDIMYMLLVSRNPFVFVGKKELAKIPIFGFFYKRVCILVDREDVRSRTGVYLKAQRRLDQGLGICIFPEGGVPDDETLLLDDFKDGAFKMAISHKIPVVPIVFYDNKARFPFSLNAGGPGPLRARVLRFFETEHLEARDTQGLRDRVREAILIELSADIRS